MHVYTFVWLKLDWIGFLIVGLKHLDYLIDSRITPACIRSIRSDFAFCTGSRFFSRGPWAGSRRTAASFLWNNHKQEHYCASRLCNYHVHHIRNVQRCSFVLLFLRHLFLNAEAEFVVAGDVKRSAEGGSITTSWNEYSANYRTGVSGLPLTKLGP